jgi:hypothetical protein
MTDYEYNWEEKYASIVRRGGHTRFFDRVFAAQDIESLVIVSPWIGSLNRQEIGFCVKDLVRLIVAHHIPTHVVTRSPKVAPSNHDAVAILKACTYVNLYFNSEVHAKVYVCRCRPVGFALLSSANLSDTSATDTVEIGLMIEGKGYGEKVVQELEVFGKYDMPAMPGTYVEKYAEKFSDRP